MRIPNFEHSVTVSKTFFYSQVIYANK